MTKSNKIKMTWLTTVLERRMCEFVVKDNKTLGVIYFYLGNEIKNPKWNTFGLAFIELDKKTNKTSQASIVKLLVNFAIYLCKRHSDKEVRKERMKIERILKKRYKMANYRLVRDFIPLRKCGSWVKNMEWGSAMKELWNDIEPIFRDQVIRKQAHIDKKIAKSARSRPDG